MKNIIKVPFGINFISDWKEYTLPKSGHSIIDKGVTGCGYTEWCLTNKYKTVLCSPRKLLLENKCDQHTKDINIYYLKAEDYSSFDEIRQDLEVKIKECQKYSLVPKILVTYDSMHHVVDFLKEKGELDQYYFIIDEFQSIFLDSYFKPEVENSALDYLQQCKNVIYLSATPMLDKYLDQLDEFKNLEYQILDWSESGRIERARVQRKLTTKSLNQECGKIIKEYLAGKFPSVYDKKTDKIIESKEAVFYLNSVTDIIRICTAHKLSPLNTRIICSNTDKNRKALRRIGFKPGKVPLRGETNPMFMFCTKTVYVGVDFYSKCASSYVFANPNIDSLALDIGLDLPQILGRQRDDDNKFKRMITIFYKTLSSKKMITKEEFEKKKEEKNTSSEKILSIWDKADSGERAELLKKFRSDVEVRNYMDDFISISTRTGTPVINKLIQIADQRAWDVCQKDYQDSINVTKALSDSGYIIGQYQTEEQKEAGKLLGKITAHPIFANQMKEYCGIMDDKNISEEIKECLNTGLENPMMEQYYLFYGTDGCKARKFRDDELKKGWDDKTISPNLTDKIYQEFKVGDKLTRKGIKDKLQKIYSKLKINKKAKATDLSDWFETKETKIGKGSTIRGFELIKKLKGEED